MDKADDQISEFNLIEYVTFGSLLAVSGLIGLYYGCIKGNQNTVTEYMLGGKTMSVFPIAMSLIASHISGVTLLGVPAEIYEYGSQFTMMVLSTFVVVYITNEFYIPVFYSLQLYSVYEYLELRFSKGVRKLCSFIFTTGLLFFIPMVIYVPALAFHKVSGINVHYFTPVICLLCIFYTTIGGLKAVVWTDVVQGLFTLGVTVVLIALGVKRVGGWKNIYEANVRGDRWEFFNFDYNPLSRVTFWTTIIGSVFVWMLNLTVHPGSSQRFVSLPTMGSAKRSVVWFGIGVNTIFFLSSTLGVIIYARYEKCDPFMANIIEKSSEILPHYVQEVALSYPGLTGLFICGLVSAALSTMSAGLNTVAGTLYEDFIEGWLPKYTTDGLASLIMKVIVVVMGCICVLFVYIVEHLGGIIEVSYSLFSCQNAAIFVAFALGLFFPWANSKGAYCGVISSIVVDSWIILGAELAKINGNLVQTGKYLSTEGCNMNVTRRNVTSLSGLREVGDGVYIHRDLNPIHALSFLYYTPIGALVGVIVGLLVSYLTGGNDLEKLNPKLITPPIRKLFPELGVKDLDTCKSMAEELKLITQERV